MRLYLLLVAGGLIAQPLHAQTQNQTQNQSGAQAPGAPGRPQSSASGRIVYPADFYNPTQPRTAYDMVSRTPGFTLQEGDNRRGYAGSLGNVLIDGQRPVGKTQPLADTLQQIPAAQVLRIEILSGADLAGDPSGFPILINIVRVTSAGQGIWGAGAEYANRGRPAPNGYINWSGRWHDTAYSLGSNAYSLHRDLLGIYTDRDGQGHLISTGRETSPRTYDELAVNGSVAHPLFGGGLDLNAKLKTSRYRETTQRDTLPATGDPASLLTPYAETHRISELGGQYDRDLGLWKVKLIGLFNRTHFASTVTSTQLPADTRFHQELDHRSAENILRASLTRSFGTRRLEFGYERAGNSLAATLDLSFTAGGTVYPIPVPDSNARIDEQRDDLYADGQWQIARNLNAELRLGYESSALTFRGDTNKRATYRFFKPSLTVTRTFGANQIVFRHYRDVGQIDFDDFVSAASLKDAVINGGNPDLRPQTQWRTELTGDLHFAPRTTLNVRLFHSAISDTADLVPIEKDGTHYDAPGNIGKGRIDGVQFSLHLPLDRIIPGGALQIDTLNQTTRVTDPLTRRARIISSLPTSTHTLAFRQDLPKHHLNWGIDYADTSALTKYRFNETDTTQDASFLSLFAERNNLGPYSLKATIYTTANGDILRRRVISATDRTGPVAHVEDQKHAPGAWLNLTLSRLF